MWKWIEAGKRNLKFKMLNAILKLQNYLRMNNDTFPGADELLEHVEAVREERRVALANLGTSDNPPRHRLNWYYLHRFNLRPEDIDLLPELAARAQEPDRTAKTAWGFYCRFLLEKNKFYQFTTLRPELYLHVAETKSVPNRAPPGPDDCQGRPLVIVWYEYVANAGGGAHITPCSAFLRGKYPKRSLTSPRLYGVLAWSAYPKTRGGVCGL